MLLSQVSLAIIQENAASPVEELGAIHKLLLAVVGKFDDL